MSYLSKLLSTPLLSTLLSTLLPTMLLFSQLVFASSTAQAAEPSQTTNQSQAADQNQPATAPKVLLATNMGEIVIELNPTAAPISVANFLSYVDAGFYSETQFHRVIKDFMIQGGGFDKNMRKKQTRNPIKNEAKNGLKNIKGSLAMARTSIVDSATSQFFINLSDNQFLDHGSRDFGYAVFGQVIKGMDVVERIGQQRTTVKQGMRDVPAKPIYIKSVTRL